jgi:hypothetical protein
MDWTGYGTAFLNTLFKGAADGTAGTVQRFIADNIIGGIDGAFKKIGFDVDVNQSDFYPLGAVAYWDKIIKSVKDVNQNLGISGTLSKTLEENFKLAYSDAVEIGANQEDVAKNYQQYVSETGRAIAMTSNQMYNLTEMSKVFGMESTKVISTYNGVGLGISESTKRMKRLVIESNKMGLVPSEVMKELNANLDAIDKYSFKNGVKAMEKMAKNAILTKVSMKSALALSEKLWEGGVEGAIQMGAELQLLGGEFAAMGDPFELFYTARNEPEKFQAQLAKIASTYAVINKESGEVEINAQGMQVLREAAKATGQDFTELAKAGKNMRKVMNIEGLFDASIKGKNDFDDILNKVAGVAEYDKTMNQWVVRMQQGGKEVVKSISALTEGDIAKLDLVGEVSEQDVFKSIIKSNETLSETLQRLINTLKVDMLSSADYTEFYSMAQQAASNIKETLAPIIEAFKTLNAQSIENIKKWANPLSEGELAKTFQGLWSNVTDTFNGIFVTAGKIFLNIIAELGKTLLATMKYAWDYGISSLYNSIVLPILKIFNSSAEPMLAPDASEIYKGISFSEAITKALPDVAKSLVGELYSASERQMKYEFGQIFSGESETDKKNKEILQRNIGGLDTKIQERLISEYISDDVKNPTKGPKILGTERFYVEINGEIKMVSPDGSVKSIGAAELEEVKKFVVDAIQKNISSGGKSTSPTNVTKLQTR